MLPPSHKKASLRKAKAQSLYEAVAKHGEHAEAAGEAREVRFAARHVPFFEHPYHSFHLCTNSAELAAEPPP